MAMKQFNLEEYLKNPSKKVITRDGRSARIICTDRVNFDSPVMALVMTKSGIESSYSYRTNGQLFRTDISDQDLFFVPEKHEVWINLYKWDNSVGCYVSNPFSSEEKAIKASRMNSNYLKTFKIEWEE